MAALDWSQCAAVESIRGKVSGAWVFVESALFRGNQPDRANDDRGAIRLRVDGGFDANSHTGSHTKPSLGALDVLFGWVYAHP
jgi:hypothetical protein